MAEYEMEEPQVAVEVKVVEADVDDFAKVIQEKFEEAGTTEEITNNIG